MKTVTPRYWLQDAAWGLAGLLFAAASRLLNRQQHRKRKEAVEPVLGWERQDQRPDLGE